MSSEKRLGGFFVPCAGCVFFRGGIKKSIGQCVIGGIRVAVVVGKKDLRKILLLPFFLSSLFRSSPNSGNAEPSCDLTLTGLPAELKHISKQRKRNQPGFP